MRNISITHPVTNGQVCLSVEYVEGHDTNPSCFVMFRCIATAGHDMSTVINGTMMCVHLSPQVYTIVATDTDINTTTPPVIIYNVTVPYYPQTTSSMLSPSTVLMSSSQSLLMPTGKTISVTENSLNVTATAGVMKPFLPVPIFFSIVVSGKKPRNKSLDLIQFTTATVLLFIVIITIVIILGCVLWRQKKPKEPKPKQVHNTALSFILSNISPSD